MNSIGNWSYYISVYVRRVRLCSMLIEYCSTDFEFEDDRGKLIQLFHDGYKQVNVITCKKNSIRGGHYHKLNKELFFVISGSFVLELSLGKIKEKYSIKQGDMFTIGPEIVHSFYYLEDTLIVSAYSEGVELSNGTKDIYREVE